MSTEKNNFDPISCDRTQKLLRLLIARYIRDGEPVASKTLVNDLIKEAQLKMSPATIRNIMADLEAIGFLHSPHTSAGRVPTSRAYRFFVDELLNTDTCGDIDVSEFTPKLEACTETKEILSATSSFLSEMTRFASIIMLPRHERAILKQIEFINLSENRILVVLVLHPREVQNRIIHAERKYSTAELRETANYLNENFAGLELKEIRQKIFASLEDVQKNLTNLLDLVVNAAKQVFSSAASEDSDFVISGEKHLFDFVQTEDMDKMRALFDIFSEKRNLLHLLDQCINAPGIKIYIGEESGYEAFDDCSLIAAPYSLNNKIVGVLGVIGPTRMEYDRVISTVNMTARLLSAALKGEE